MDGASEIEGTGVGDVSPAAPLSGTMGATDRVPSRVIGARHFRQWITVTLPATRSFHNCAAMLNFAPQAVHATGNDIRLSFEARDQRARSY